MVVQSKTTKILNRPFGALKALGVSLMLLHMSAFSFPQTKMVSGETVHETLDELIRHEFDRLASTQGEIQFPSSLSVSQKMKKALEALQSEEKKKKEEASTSDQESADAKESEEFVTIDVSEFGDVIDYFKTNKTSFSEAEKRQIMMVLRQKNSTDASEPEKSLEAFNKESTELLNDELFSLRSLSQKGEGDNKTFGAFEEPMTFSEGTTQALNDLAKSQSENPDEYKNKKAFSPKDVFELMGFDAKIKKTLSDAAQKILDDKLKNFGPDVLSDLSSNIRLANRLANRDRFQETRTEDHQQDYQELMERNKETDQPFLSDNDPFMRGFGELPRQPLGSGSANSRTPEDFGEMGGGSKHQPSAIGGGGPSSALPQGLSQNQYSPGAGMAPRSGPQSFSGAGASQFANMGDRGLGGFMDIEGMRSGTGDGDRLLSSGLSCKQQSPTAKEDLLARVSKERSEKNGGGMLGYQFLASFNGRSEKSSCHGAFVETEGCVFVTAKHCVEEEKEGEPLQTATQIHFGEGIGTVDLSGIGGRPSQNMGTIRKGGPDHDAVVLFLPDRVCGNHNVRKFDYVKEPLKSDDMITMEMFGAPVVGSAHNVVADRSQSHAMQMDFCDSYNRGKGPAEGTSGGPILTPDPNNPGKLLITGVVSSKVSEFGGYKVPSGQPAPQGFFAELTPFIRDNFSYHRNDQLADVGYSPRSSASVRGVSRRLNPGSPNRDVH